MFLVALGKHFSRATIRSGFNIENSKGAPTHVCHFADHCCWNLPSRFSAILSHGGGPELVVTTVQQLLLLAARWCRSDTSFWTGRKKELAQKPFQKRKRVRARMIESSVRSLHFRYRSAARMHKKLHGISSITDTLVIIDSCSSHRHFRWFPASRQKRTSEFGSLRDRIMKRGH